MNQSSTQPNYWIARMTYLSQDLLEEAIETGIFITHYRYDSNAAKPRRIASFLKGVLEVKVGDVLLLTVDNGIYAFGYVQKCPYESKQISTITEVKRTHTHDYTAGIVRFSDSEVFYEDLKGGIEGWGQRIKVDEWHYYSKSPKAYTDEQRSNLREGYSTQDTLCGVLQKYGEDKIESLK